jgi:hypothetical protein
MNPDAELLQRYATDHSESAFSQLIREPEQGEHFRK